MEPENPSPHEPSPEAFEGLRTDDEPTALEASESEPSDTEGVATEGAAEPLAEPAVEPPHRFDRRWLVAGVIAVLVLLFGLVFLLQARRDVSTLQAELRVLRAEVHRSQVLQERGAVLRARAELQALRQTLPPDLAPEIDKADALLGGVDDRLKASP